MSSASPIKPVIQDKLDEKRKILSRQNSSAIYSPSDENSRKAKETREYLKIARKFEDEKFVPKVLTYEDEIKNKAQMYIDAIKNDKITEFTKIWAKKNKGDLDKALKIGLIKQEDYNNLMHD